MTDRQDKTKKKSLASRIRFWWLIAALVMMLGGMVDVPDDYPTYPYSGPGGRARVVGETVGKYHGGNAFAKGKGKFTVTESENSQIPVGSVLVTQGRRYTDFRKKIDKEYRTAKIGFYVLVPDIKVSQPFWVTGKANLPCMIPQQVGDDKYRPVSGQCRTQPVKFKVVPADLAAQHDKAKATEPNPIVWVGGTLLIVWMFVWPIVWVVKGFRTHGTDQGDY